MELHEFLDSPEIKALEDSDDQVSQKIRDLRQTEEARMEQIAEQVERRMREYLASPVKTWEDAVQRADLIIGRLHFNPMYRSLSVDWRHANDYLKQRSTDIEEEVQAESKRLRATLYRRLAEEIRSRFPSAPVPGMTEALEANAPWVYLEGLPK